jgi:hypothetical protein
MDGDDGRSEEPELVHEDFSVYVAPRPFDQPADATPIQMPGSDGELLARLEPSIAVVALPLLGLTLLFLSALSPFSGRYHIPIGFLGIYPSNARYIAATILGVTLVVAALPYFLAPSYFAELLGDRLVVRRGKREWAVPLEEIASITPINDSSTMTKGPWVVDLIDAFAKFGALPERFAQPRSNGYLVVTTFGTVFALPPLPGADEFVTVVYRQRAARLKMRPAVVPGADDSDPGQVF